MRRQRRQCGGRRRLRLFAAETAAHARHLHDNFVGGEMQNVRNDLLHFAGMLRRGNDCDRTIFAAFGVGGLRFEIKMFLPAKFEFTF
jgi:hypothetical protein